MSTKRVLSIVLVVSAVLLAVGVGPRFAGTARALPPAGAGAVAPAGAAAQQPEPGGATIPYSGRLTDDAGQPVADGAYDFAFALYAAESGGEAVWSETQAGVSVQGGAFTAALGSISPLPDGAKEGGLWLEVGVRGPGEVEFTRLSPRQALSAAALLAPASPSAGPSCAHDHWGEFWGSTGTGKGLDVYHYIEVSGIPLPVNGVTLSPSNGNGLEALSGNGAAVHAQGANGVVGVSTTPGWAAVVGRNNAPGGIGVWGDTTAVTGTAVYGKATATSGTNYGVYGVSTSGTGVYGSGPNGVVGVSSRTGWAAVVGRNNAAGGIGVWGDTTAITGTAVHGEATATSGTNYGVYGQSHSSSGYGVYGKSSGTGVYGNGGTGVYGNGGTGVKGEASGANGIGVHGIATIDSGRGVLGTAGASGGTGVYGYSLSGPGVVGESNSGPAVEAVSPLGGGNLIEARNPAPWNNLAFRVDSFGNVYMDGTHYTPAADMAEMLPAGDNLEPGDVLAVGPDGTLTRSTQPYQTSVVGVYSTRPGFVGGAPEDADPTGKVPLAVAGVVPVKVSAENGSIHPGDLLVASSTPGHAMRAPDNPAPGTVIGKALGGLESGTGVIEMLVMLR